MSNTVDYSKLADTRETRDLVALDDLSAWMGERRMGILLAEATKAVTAAHVARLNMVMSFAGVTGLPFHAFCRANCLEAYRGWMADGDDGVPTDAAGFREV